MAPRFGDPLMGFIVVSFKGALVRAIVKTSVNG